MRSLPITNFSQSLQRATRILAELSNVIIFFPEHFGVMNIIPCVGHHCFKFMNGSIGSVEILHHCVVRFHRFPNVLNVIASECL